VKTSQITSYERNAKIELTFEGQSDSEEMQKAIDFIEAYVDEFSMSWNEKFSANEEMTKTKMAADFDVDMKGLGVKMNYWMDVDFSGDNPQMKYIVELPPPITQPFFSSAGLESKKYIALDFAKNEEIGADMDFNNVAKKSTELRDMVLDFIKTSATNFEPGMIAVNKKGSATTDRGEKVTEYELKLSDATAKQLLKSFINEVVLQEDSAEFIKKYLEATLEMIEMEEEDKQEALEELDKSINEMFIEQLPTYRENVAQVFEMINDVKFLGDKGVTINYFVNKDGYIVGTNASIDIEINLADLAAAVGSTDVGEGTFRFGITCESSLNNINKEVNVEMPELTKDNSLDILDMIETKTTGPLFGVPSISDLTDYTNISEPVLYDGINVFMNGRHIAFDDTKPENINGRILVPVRTISEEMGADVSYNNETKQVTIVKGDKTIVLTIGSQEAYVNGEKVLFDVPAMIVEGRTMVPLRFVSENMDAYVDWDGESQVVSIIY